MNKQTVVFNTISAVFGVLFSAIGILNVFWGNDSFYGLFVLTLSLIFYLPISNFIRSSTGFYIPVAVKILLGMFILWSAFGVGELFAKIKLMLQFFNTLTRF